ncbi:putative glycosidase CRH2 [Microbotryomycetes sp. JL221]|nr:putative glycosidase CRH2 [Microbotryomycetes sp. JL221]
MKLHRGKRYSFATLACLVVPSVAQQSLQAVFPGGSNVKQIIGDKCVVRWNKPSTTGEAAPDGLGSQAPPVWTQMNIDLMTGSNLEMKNLTRIGRNINANELDHFEYTCPNVEPKSSIYFYQFSDEGPSEHVWTSRFALVDRDNMAQPPEHQSQPNGEPVPWGTGRLVGQDLSSLGNQMSQHWPYPSHSATTSTPSILPAANKVQQPQTGITGFHPNGLCSKDSKCPDSHPCCSEHGFCGTGRSCLNGCNPLWSAKADACAPVAACLPKNMTFKPIDVDRIENGTLWTGDANRFDWVIDRVAPNVTSVAAGDELVLQLKQGANGTSLSSTRSIWYGNVTARIKSSVEPGVVTSFSLISGVQDEIVWEFTGAIDTASTNYFRRGQMGQGATDSAPTFRDEDIPVGDRGADFADFGIVWTPETLSWTLNGKIVRSVQKRDTHDPSTGLYGFPSTPSRLQFKIFAISVDDPSDLQEWSGGSVKWDSPTYIVDGYYASRIRWVNVECFDAVEAAVVANSANTPTSIAPWTSTTNDGIRVAAPPLDKVHHAQIGSAKTDLLKETASETVEPPLGWLIPTPPAASPTWILEGGHPLKKLKRRVIELFRRADTGPAYAYNGIDEHGLVQVVKGNFETSLSSDDEIGSSLREAQEAEPQQAPDKTHDTGLQATHTKPTQGAATPTKAAVDWFSDFWPSVESETTSGFSVNGATDVMISTGLISASVTSSSPVESQTAKTVQESWDELGVPAHVGIYVGAGLVALLLVTLIAWCWRTVSKSRGIHQADKGLYAPINDKGELVQHQQYSGTGEIVPGGDLYSGGQAPAPTPSRRATFQGGFRPSSRASPFYQPSAEAMSGASGIGLGMVKHLLDNGANVVIGDINATQGAEIVKTLEPQSRVVFCACDVTSWRSQTELFAFTKKTFGRIDFVFANAGIAQMREMRASDPTHFASRKHEGLDTLAEDEPDFKVVRVDLDGVLYTIHAALAYFRSQDKDEGGWRGKIVATASNAAFYPFPNDTLYSAAKHGVLGACKAVGIKVFSEGITVNCIGPSVVATQIGPQDYFARLGREGRLTPLATLARALDIFFDPRCTASGRILENTGNENVLRANAIWSSDLARNNMSDFHDADECDAVLAGINPEQWGVREVKESI